MDRTEESSAGAFGDADLSTRLAFDGWTLDRVTGDLWKEGVRQRLQELPLRILNELLAKPGELVTREQLIARLWPKGVVDFDTGLNTAMRKLRVALGDDPDQPRYIETLPRKGYRFICRVERPAGTERREKRQPPLARWAAALVLLACAAVLIAWSLSRSSSPSVGQTSPIAADLYFAAMTRQPDISPHEGAEPRQRVLDLLGRALAIYPSFAPAYVVRARTNLDFFVSNVDVSEELLEAIRKDLETARHLSRDDRIGLDVRALYAALVDLDPEGGLRLAESAPNDPDALHTRATILMTLGRFRESDEIFDRFLALDPANQRLLRIKISNLLAERRGLEARALIATLSQVSAPGRSPPTLTDTVTGEYVSARPSFAQVQDSLQRDNPDGERLLQMWSELYLMRVEHRYDEIRDLLEVVRAESVRTLPFMGALPGLGRQPVACFRGWNEMLRGDAAAAAVNGRKVLDFAARQRATRWNAWYLRMLEAQAQVMMGNAANAVAAVRDSLQASSSPLPNRHIQIYREYLAAVTLAWAGEHDASVALLEKLSRGGPSVGAAFISRDPLISDPLRRNERYERLRSALEAEINANKVH